MSQRWVALERIADIRRQLEALALDLERLGVDPIRRASVTVKAHDALVTAEQVIFDATRESTMAGPGAPRR